MNIVNGWRDLATSLSFIVKEVRHTIILQYASMLCYVCRLAMALSCMAARLKDPSVALFAIFF